MVPALWPRPFYVLAAAPFIVISFAVAIWALIQLNVNLLLAQTVRSSLYQGSACYSPHRGYVLGPGGVAIRSQKLEPATRLDRLTVWLSLALPCHHQLLRAVLRRSLRLGLLWWCVLLAVAIGVASASGVLLPGARLVFSGPDLCLLISVGCSLLLDADPHAGIYSLIGKRRSQAHGPCPTRDLFDLPPRHPRLHATRSWCLSRWHPQVEREPSNAGAAPAGGDSSGASNRAVAVEGDGVDTPCCRLTGRRSWAVAGLWRGCLPCARSTLADSGFLAAFLVRPQRDQGGHLL